MKALLQHKSRRINFLITIALIIAVIILIRAYVIPTHFPDDTQENIKYFKDFLDKVAISLLVSVFTAWFLFQIEVPEEEVKHEIVEPDRLTEIFAKARMDSNFWYFSGGTGRYTRAVTLPEMSKISQDTNESRSIKILLMDPNDIELCQKYTTFRKGLNSAKDAKSPWTLDYTRNEIIATICSAIIHKSNNPMLEISIFLKKTFSTLRIDLNHKNCIVTKEDKKAPALVTPINTFLYKTYKEEIFHTCKQSKELDVKLTMENVKFGNITTENIKSICTNVQINIQEANFKSIAEILNENYNPYN